MRHGQPNRLPGSVLGDSLEPMCAVKAVCGVLAMGLSALAQTTTVLTYNAGSTLKVEQLVGDVDYQTKKPTASQTVTRYNILGSDIGYSFESNGKLIFTFGDTISKDASVLNYRAADPLASSTSTNPDAGMLLNYYTAKDGTPLFVKPPGVVMGADDVPNSGISLADGIYLIVNTGADVSLPNAHLNDVSLLVKFDETAQTFTAGRTISKMPGGHFIITSPVLSGSDVYMFGTGAYRASDIFLQKVPATAFASGTGTQYFAGITNGQPVWVNSESSAVPVVQDNPLNGPAWPNDDPTAANLSVVYSANLGLWLMTYDGGRQSPRTNGVYFTYAPEPWGPWAAPQLIYSGRRDGGLGTFIHDPSIVPDPPGDGLNGPTIGPNDIYTTPGGAYAPLMIGRFTTVTGNTLKIYYTLSTWNPYTIVRMKSEFTITKTQPATTMNNVNYFGDSSLSHALDLYLPAGSGPFPLVVLIHGGGWSTGSKEAATQYTGGLPPRGIAVASINYRLSGEAKWPAQIQDCKAAVRFLRANATKYGIDPNRIAAMGDSAGAHLAAMVATTSDVALWDTPGMPNASVPAQVQGLVTLAAPFAMFSSTDLTGANAFAQMLGCASLAACPDKVKEAVPITYVTANDPPALILQGTHDSVTYPDNARIFDEAMIAAGRPVMYRMMPGVQHVDDPAYKSPQILGLVGDYLDRVLNSSPATASAADFEVARFTSNEYISVFGSYLGSQTLLPTTNTLPSVLGGFSATIEDSIGKVQPAGVFALLPGQLNLLLPSSTASGAGTLTVLKNGQAVTSERVYLADSSPTMFSAYINGEAMAIGQAVWVDSKGAQQSKSLVAQSGNQLQAPALPFSQSSGPVTIIVYGTGLANGAAAGKTVLAYLGSTKLNVTYAGKQGQYDGLDQYNIEIPRSFAGQGTLTLSISADGNPATPLRVVN